MFFILIAAGFIGIFFHRIISYWILLVLAYIAIVVATLFPIADYKHKLTAHVLEQIIAKNYHALILGLVIIVLLFGGLMLLFYFLDKNKEMGNELPNGEDGSSEVSKERKFIEFAILVVFLLLSKFFIAKIPAIAPVQVEAPQEVVIEEQQVEEIPYESVEERVRKAGIEMNRNLPQKASPTTTLEKVTTTGRTITYHYTITQITDKVKIRNFVLPSIIDNRCGNDEVRKSIREDGISYTYIYNLVDAKSELEIVLDDALCKQFGR